MVLGGEREKATLRPEEGSRRGTHWAGLLEEAAAVGGAEGLRSNHTLRAHRPFGPVSGGPE